MDTSVSDRTAKLLRRTQDLAYLEELLTSMNARADPDTGNRESIEYWGAGAACETRPNRDADELSAKRESLERLIRSRCDSLAEHLCGSMSDIIARGSPPPSLPPAADPQALFSWNAKLSLVDRDLTAVRRLICPEREEGNRDDDDDEASSGGRVDVGAVTEVKTILGDIDRLIAPGKDGGGGEEEEVRRWCAYETGRRRSRTAVEMSWEQRQRCARRLQLSAGGSVPPTRDYREDVSVVDAAPRGCASARSGFDGARPTTLARSVTFAKTPPVATAGAGSASPKRTTPNVFARLPEERRTAAYQPSGDNDCGGRNTKPDRVDPRDVLRRQYCPPSGATDKPLRRQIRPSKPVVSKHPQLPTIVEEREAKLPTTPVAQSRTPAANGSHKTFQPSKLRPPQCGTVTSRGSEVEATNRRTATGSARAAPPPPLQGGPPTSPGRREDEANRTERVRETSRRLGESRGAADGDRVDLGPSTRSDTSSSPRGRRGDATVEDVAHETVDPREDETATAVTGTRCGSPEVTPEKTEGDDGEIGEDSWAEEAVERGRVTLGDVGSVEEVKRLERSRSTPDVTRLQRSWLTRARNEDGGNEGPPGDVTCGRNAGGLKFLAAVEDKLSYNQELVVLLWMCDLSERLETRSREATNRMRKAVGVGDATLTKLRLLKESLLNDKVTVRGDSPQ